MAGETDGAADADANFKSAVEDVAFAFATLVATSGASETARPRSSVLCSEVLLLRSRGTRRCASVSDPGGGRNVGRGGDGCDDTDGVDALVGQVGAAVHFASISVVDPEPAVAQCPCPRYQLPRHRWRPLPHPQSDLCCYFGPPMT